MFCDNLIVRRVPKWIVERTRENYEVYNMGLSDSFEEAVKNYPKLKRGSELWKAWYYNDFRLYIPSAYLASAFDFKARPLYDGH